MYVFVHDTNMFIKVKAGIYLYTYTSERTCLNRILYIHVYTMYILVVHVYKFTITEMSESMHFHICMYMSEPCTSIVRRASVLVCTIAQYIHV